MKRTKAKVNKSITAFLKKPVAESIQQVVDRSIGKALSSAPTSKPASRWDEAKISTVMQELKRLVRLDREVYNDRMERKVGLVTGPLLNQAQLVLHPDERQAGRWWTPKFHSLARTAIIQVLTEGQPAGAVNDEQITEVLKDKTRTCWTSAEFRAVAAETAKLLYANKQKLKLYQSGSRNFSLTSFIAQAQLNVLAPSRRMATTFTQHIRVKMLKALKWQLTKLKQAEPADEVVKVKRAYTKRTAPQLPVGPVAKPDIDPQQVAAIVAAVIKALKT